MKVNSSTSVMASKYDTICNSIDDLTKDGVEIQKLEKSEEM